MSMSEKYAGSVLALVATLIVIAAVRNKWGSSRRPPYPPGPKGYPIIGNVFDFPHNPIWEALAKMSREYSEWIASWFLSVLTWVYHRRYGHFASGYDGVTPSHTEQQRHCRESSGTAFANIL